MAKERTISSINFVGHPRTQKVTWRQPAGQIENQIDRIFARGSIRNKKRCKACTGE